ncbi:MAG: hypothetical protein IBX61_07260 [Thermoleophilia bacterium]|nr:hypothetical protein [Thermoleophilia bacterium]
MKKVLIAFVVLAALASLVPFFLYKADSQSEAIAKINRKIEQSGSSMVVFDGGAWRTDAGTKALEKAAEEKLAQQAAEEAKRAEEARLAAIAAQEWSEQETVGASAVPEVSCEELIAQWEAQYAGVPSYMRGAPIPCGPCAGYASRWTCEQAIGPQY